FESLDEPANGSDPVLEREPRVPLAPLAAPRRADTSSLDPKRPDAARIPVQPARGEQGVKEGQPKGGLDGSGPEIDLDPVEDCLEPDELAWRVKIEQAVDQVGTALDDR